MKLAIGILILVTFLSCSNEGENSATKVDEDVKLTAEDLAIQKKTKNLLFFASDTSSLIGKARKGDAQAQYYLGIIFYEIKDYNQALGWFNKAIIQEYQPAQKHVASLYLTGASGFRNRDKAFELYNILAAGGDLKSMKTLAENTYSSAEEIKWYQAMADLGDLESIHTMAKHHLNWTNDPDKALELYKKALRLGDQSAYEGIIQVYSRQGEKVDAYALALLLKVRGNSKFKEQLFPYMESQDILEAQEKCKTLLSE